MNQGLGALLSKLNPSREDVYDCIMSTDLSRVRLVIKSKERLIELLFTDSNDVTMILHKLTTGKDIIQGLAEVNQKLSVICDKMLKNAIQPPVNISDEEEIQKKAGELTVIDEMIRSSNRLKIQLGGCIHEYILSSFSRERIHPTIAVKAMKLILSAISQCPENKIVFSRTNSAQINGIFDFITNTSDPMGQAYAAEILWRILTAMKGKRSRSDIEKLFGSFLQEIEAINAEDFCGTIHNFLRNLNVQYRNIYSIDISNLVIGGQFVSEKHAIDIGDSKMMIWITPGAKWSIKQEKCDLINLKIEDILGISKLENHWAIPLDENFNTLSDCFNPKQRKCIFFDPIQNDAETDHIFSVISEKFGSFDSDYLEYPEKKDGKHKMKPEPSKPKQSKNKKIEEERHSITPKPKPKVSNQQDKQNEDVSKTPKAASKYKSINLSKTIATPQTPSVTKLHAFTSSKNVPKIPLKNDYFFSSDSSDLLPSFDLHDLSDTESSSPIQVKSPEKAVRSRKFTPDQGKIKKQAKNVSDSNSTSKREKEDKIQNKNIQSKPKQKKVIEKKQSKKNEKEAPKEVQKSNVIDVESSDDIPKPELSSEDELPAPSFSQSFTFESDEEHENMKDEEKSIEDVQKSKSTDLDEKRVEEGSQPIRKDEETKVQDDFSLNIQPVQIKPISRTYAPDRWELEAFEELKAFANIVRTKLFERHDDVAQVIEDTTSNAIGEVNSFMAKCDQDLEKLRSNFKETSATIASDISSKQKMVQELGEQQREHIDQMQKDCAILQKRADEMVKRFEQQKKQLIQNQQKHIALFREDLKTEVKTAVTKRKREYSRNKVQKLVNLLEEL